MESLLKVPADAIDRLTPDALELDCALRARGMGDVADELLFAKLEPGIVGIQITGVQSVDPPIFAAQYPVDHPYAKGKAINLGASTIAGGGGSAVADLVTAGYQYLTVFSRLGNATTPATAAADLSAFVNAYEDDGTTLYPPGIGAALVQDFFPVALTLTGSIAYVVKRYLLSGIDKVRVVIQNSNVAALQGGTAVYYLQK